MSQPSFDFGDGADEALDDPVNPTYTVGELADAINAQLRRGFDDGVWVRGEIDGLRHSGPHTYFAVVEHGERGKAVLNVSLFAPMKRNLTPLLKRHRLDLGNGMKVRIFGHLDYYAPNGRLGLKMAGIDPRFTLGELSQARDQVVRRLVAAGLFDANARRPLSPAPLNVGVVTSVGTAAWHDFHDEIIRSGLGFRLAVCDTRVQGDGAATSIAAAIRTLSERRGLDAVVVIRGGGARNELATFDDESIAMAIATSTLPVLTGLGHEVDRSVADEVAHTALKTPTACAGELIAHVVRYRDACESAWQAIRNTASAEVASAHAALGDRAHRIARRTHAAVERADERLETRSARLRHAPTVALRAASRDLDAGVTRLTGLAPSATEREQRRLSDIEARVRLLDPERLLERGWSITRRADGVIVRTAADVDAGDVITTQIADGTLTSRIEDA